MWERIKEFKILLGIVVIIAPMAFTSIVWTVNNIVFASEFNQYKLSESLKWLNYDEQRIRSEYYNLRNLRKMNDRDKRRFNEVETQLDRITSKRIELEKELRSSSRIKITR